MPEAITAASAPTERAHGTWRGRTVSFNRLFAGHRFTDEEVLWLLDGETIAFVGTTRHGERMRFAGRLVLKRCADGREYVRFAPDFDGDGVPTRGADPDDVVPRSWCGRVFSDEQRRVLASGGRVRSTFRSPNTGRDFECEVSFDRQGPRRRIVAHMYA